MNTPDLLFGSDMSVSGFTPAGVSAFSDLRATAVVRELIQNSLDAALIAANEKCARVRLRKFSCNTGDIPGIDSYRKAFEQAIETHTQSGKKDMPTQAKLVVDRIRRALQQKMQAVLSITDNGVGLDKRTMSALLSDGISVKGGKAAGTYGNGHTVAIPASNLRYILYGGLTDGGETLASGHALLASHKKPGESQMASAHGFFIESMGSSEEGVYYSFPGGRSIPGLIQTELECIRTEHGRGTAIIIPAFNQFGDDESLWKIVSQATACNFFQAIHSGQLIVEVEEDQPSGESRDTKILNKEILPEILDEHKGETRIGRRGAFLSGRKANDAYQTLVQGTSSIVKTSHEEVQVSLRICDEGKPSVGLCRNGMWITENLPMLQNVFHNQQPFQALILLGPERRNEFYGLIQDAETPLHNELALKLMPAPRQKSLRKALGEIRDWIRQNVPEAISESYSPEDVLAFQFEGAEAKGGPRGNQRSFWGSPVTTEKRFPQANNTGTQSGLQGEPGSGQGNGGSGNRKERRDKEKSRRVAVPYFRVVSTPDGPDRQKILVDCKQDCENAELRIFVDENIDATCDRQSPSQISPLFLSDVSINGKQVSTKNLLRGEHGYNGIDLGTLQAETEIVVEAGYRIPEDILSVIPGNAPTLRVEIVSRKEKPESTAKSKNQEKNNA